MASLRDVAQRAGVSLATASRVASGQRNVQPNTRARVEAAMRDLLYVAPHRPEPSGAIGLLVPEFSNPVFATLAQAMEARATAAGFATILCNTAGSAARELGYVHMLLERRVEAMIFICSEITDLRGEHVHYAQLRAGGARLVFVNGALNSVDVPSVGVDEQCAGELATQHLIDLGHTQIGFVAGPEHSLPTRDKAVGRMTALRAAGLDPDGLVAHGSFTIDGARSAFRELMSKPQPPTGVICSSDLMAIGVLQEAVATGLRVPEDLSIVGFDGIDASTWTVPPLTTIEQPIAEIAETAVASLQRLIDEPDRPQPSSYFRPRLVVRSSTSAPPSARATSKKSSQRSNAAPSRSR